MKTKSYLLLTALGFLSSSLFAQDYLVSTPNTSLLIEATPGETVKIQYYGSKIENSDIQGIYDVGMVFNADSYPAFGLQTMGEKAIAATQPDGNMSLDLKIEQVKQYPTKDGEVTEILLKDKVYPFEIKQYYKAYQGTDIISTWIEIMNNGKKSVTLYRFVSAYLPVQRGDNWLTHFHGHWGAENMLEEEKLTNGQKVISNKDGMVNTETDNPSFMLSIDGKPQEEYGHILGGTLAWTGNYLLKMDITNTKLNIIAGINEENSHYKLEPKETFKTPEFAMTYSTSGKGGVSRAFHRWARMYKLSHGNVERDILLNSWEGVYFKVNQEGMDQMMKSFSALGGELFVMDDGWFGKRNNDKSSLGDWFVNTDKLPGSLKGLSEKVDKLGMSFGLWVEPEMISEDSDLFRKHPDWALRIQGREMHEGRNQYVLDMGRDDVVAYLTDVFTAVLGSADIKYIKWDMNRNISDANSAALPPNRQGEVMHRYILGVYKLMENLVSTFPNILFEGCSGGAGRNDPGILYYMPQNWGSDNTDAVERMYIQYGAGMVYPSSTICAHVSDVPNHQVGRTTPMKLRSEVAMSAVMGYEFDLSKLTDDECYDISEQIKQYKRIRSIVCFGDLYRLINPFENRSASWMYVSEDKTKAVVFYYNKLAKPNSEIRRLKLKGLDEGKTYIVDNKEYTGRTLMNFGLYLPEYEKDFESRAWEIEEKK